MVGARPAEALITPPVTLDGPSSAINEFGGVAMANDGSGGLVYVKSVAGVPHVFACRLVAGQWSPPIRVDSEQPYAASQPAISAGPRGELLVAWVSPVTTYHGKPQYALFSARIGAGASSFGPTLPIDPNVGEGQGVEPALSSTSPGKAIIAYRVITYVFVPGAEPPVAQLRPGDVLADIRVARLSSDRWSRLGPVNANSEFTMRPPGPANGPEIGTGIDGGAVVAWQEPDQTGAARILLRRIFGTNPGPILQVSPATWEGKAVSADADAFSLSVTPYTMARVAFRIAPTAGSALAGRVLVNSLPPNFSTTAGKLTGPLLADGGLTAGGIGPPAIAVAEDSSRKVFTRVGFAGGARLRQLGGSGVEGTLSPIATPATPRTEAGAVPVVAASPDGGGIAAYPAFDALGLPTVAVRQEFASGAAQTGLVSGAQGGPISQLEIGRSGVGDGLIAFRQGEPGRYEIVADRVTVPPQAFKLKAPKGWVKPREAKLRWQAATSAVGGLTYSVLIDGRAVRRGLRRFAFHPPPAQLGNGVLEAQVMATDSLGQQLLSGSAKLRVDGLPPAVTVRARGDRVTVKLRDPDSGVDSKATRVSFGDGEGAKGGARLSHEYGRGGRFRIVVRGSDEAGNRVFRGFQVRVR